MWARWIAESAVEAFLRERNAYAETSEFFQRGWAWCDIRIAHRLEGHDVARMPTAVDVQMLIDTRSLRQRLRALERVHEDRSKPTMAFVVSTICSVSELIDEFIDDATDERLRQYGRALRREAEAYLARASAAPVCVALLIALA